MKLNEDEEDDSFNLQPLGVKYRDCTTCYSILEVYGIQSIAQVLDQQLTRPEEEEEEEGLGAANLILRIILCNMYQSCK
jgi:hypothetical protein